MSRVRILLGDDHPLFSEGLRRILEPQFEVVGVVTNGQELIAAAERLRPDVAVADISMPSLNGIEAARRMQKLPRAPKVVFLTMHEDPTFTAAAFQAGASGYVLKRSTAEEIVTALREVAKGRTYVSPLIARDLILTMMRSGENAQKTKLGLTSRQTEILQLFAEGKSPKEIAAILNISVRTVEFHKYRLMSATGAHSLADLTRYAIAHGIVHAT